MIGSLFKTNVRCIIFYLGLKLGVCVSSRSLLGVPELDFV